MTLTARARRRELVIAGYRDAFLRRQGVAIASARAGNVIGGGDWSVDRLIPDALRAWRTDQVLQVRRPDAIRPWQHVLEPLHGYLRLAETLWHQTCPGPIILVRTRMPRQPFETLWNRRALLAEARCTTPPKTKGRTKPGRTSKARTALGVSPKWGLSETVTRTVAWHRNLEDGGHARDNVCEINDYHRPTDEAAVSGLLVTEIPLDGLRQVERCTVGDHRGWRVYFAKPWRRPADETDCPNQSYAYRQTRHDARPAFPVSTSCRDEAGVGIQGEIWDVAVDIRATFLQARGPFMR